MNLIDTSLTQVPMWIWMTFGIAVTILLVIDLSLFKFADKFNFSKTKFAIYESIIWIGLALVLNFWFSLEYGKELGFQFLTGYLVEKSLSIDNIFIILLVFASFKIPPKHQHKVLFLGVLGAIIMRGFFILIGAQLIHQFHWLLYIFGGILIITAFKFLFSNDNDKEIKESWYIKAIKKIIPTSSNFHSGKFFLKENGKTKATPLLLALIVIEVTDLIFAIDSIPAVFAITQDTFVAFASNILALLGLRALYFVLSDLLNNLIYLKQGLAAILGFIGIKMLIVDFYKIPSSISLLVIISILIISTLCSWYVNKLNSKVKLEA